MTAKNQPAKKAAPRRRKADALVPPADVTPDELDQHPTLVGADYDPEAEVPRAQICRCGNTNAAVVSSSIPEATVFLSCPTCEDTIIVDAVPPEPEPEPDDADES